MGPNEKSVSAEIERRNAQMSCTAMLALTVARTIDGNDNPAVLAQLSKELRAVMTELREGHVDAKGTSKVDDLANARTRRRATTARQ